MNNTNLKKRHSDKLRWNVFFAFVGRFVKKDKKYFIGCKKFYLTGTEKGYIINRQ